MCAVVAALALGCGGRTALRVDASVPGGDAGPIADGGVAVRDASRSDASVRIDGGSADPCVASPVIQIVADSRPLEWPSVARRQEEGVIVYTVELEDGTHQVWSRPISALGEPRSVPRAIAPGIGGTVHRLDRGKSEPAFLHVWRSDADALFSAELFEDSIVVRRMRFPATETMRPAVAANDALVVIAARTDRGIESRYSLDGSGSETRAATGTHVAVALVPSAGDRAARATALDGHVHVEVFDESRVVFEERTVATGWEVRDLSVAEGPDAPVVVLGSTPEHGDNVALLFDRRGRHKVVVLTTDPTDVESAWAAGWHVAVFGVHLGDGHHVALVAAEPVERGMTFSLDLAGPFDRPVHPAIATTGDPDRPFLVVWAHTTASGSLIEARPVACADIR